ncbi:hypothetical protein [Nioella sp.]|uniref:hypothetical protein n=1 Tax=Nioella sp. TaxID=1912091 RepID=UPI00351217B6
MNKYSTARSLIAVLSIIGWITVAAGILFALVLYQSSGLRLSIPVIISLGLGGLALVAIAQMATAQLDTAENTAEMVALLKQSLARPDPAKAPQPATTPPRREPPVKAPPVPGDVVEMRHGKDIVRIENGYRAEGKDFATIGGARVWIDAQALRSGK